ncbi:MAG: indoleamine 2,3-dioxygenase [Maricaulaceae bacterium]
MLNLSEYDMSAERGFLCRFDVNDTPLPKAFHAARETAMRLPKLLPTGRVRSLLERALPDTDYVDVLPHCTEAQIRLAMVHYSFMVQSYVWGEPEAPTVLPSMLARPMVAIADALEQQPLLPYSSYVLDNWGTFDKDGPIDLSNIYMLQHFLGGQDEAWFVLVHVAIEAQAGAALALMGPIIEAIGHNDHGTVQAHLEDMAGTWGKINAIFDRMPERCDPYVYFERVRPYIHGWRDNPALPNGIIYEGVERYGSEGQAFRGQTGSQSSIVPSMDALLGIGHAADPLKAYLDQLHIYRPTAHRRFIDDVRASSTLRSFVETSGHKGLVASYNANVQAVADFRTRHLEYAASYINKQNKNGSGNDTDVGTGGTPFMKYLKKHRDETKANLISA